MIKSKNIILINVKRIIILMIKIIINKQFKDDPIIEIYQDGEKLSDIKVENLTVLQNSTSFEIDRIFYDD